MPEGYGYSPEGIRRYLEDLAKNQYTWLITGVAGFIGSNILEKLLGKKLWNFLLWD